MKKEEMPSLQHTITAFFRSPEFAEFQRGIPYRGKAWEIKESGCEALVIKQKMRLGYSWLWVPYGPAGDMTHLSDFFQELSHIARKEKAIFARIEPADALPADLLNEFKYRWPIKKSKGRFTPEHTLALDLTKSENEILAQMKPKGRYNIGVAKKHGVTIHISSDPNDVGDFYRILKKTGSRDGFGVHPELFYKTMVAVLGPKKIATLLLAQKDGATIAGSIVIFYATTAIYYYGASDYEHRNSMAPYLVQWEAIREAKRRGCEWYDFLGIAPENAGGHHPAHPWAGVTEFKKKWGGVTVSYPEAFDVVYKKLAYGLIKLLK